MTQIGSPEESERLNGLLHGPWDKISRLGRKFVQPATDFSLIVPTNKQIDLREFPLSSSDRAREAGIKWVLAPHSEDVGRNKFKIKNSPGIRDSFDEALTTIQLLEIGVQTGYVQLPEI